MAPSRLGEIRVGIEIRSRLKFARVAREDETELLSTAGGASRASYATS